MTVMLLGWGDQKLPKLGAGEGNPKKDTWLGFVRACRSTLASLGHFGTLNALFMCFFFGLSQRF